MDSKYRKGEIVEGIISNVTNYGGFVHVDYSTNGLIHISEITNGFVDDIYTYLKIGQKVYCRVLQVDDDKHQLKLSLRNVPLKIKPRVNQRKRIMMNKQELYPDNKIGFSSLEKELSKWIKEIKND